MSSTHAPASTDPPTSADDLTRSMNAIRTIVRALRVNARAIEVQTGISLAQLFVLQQLAEEPAHSLNDLAARTSTHQSSVSVVVRRLVDRGLAPRVAAPADKRRVEIAVTVAGRTLVATAPTTLQTRLVLGLEALTNEDRERLAGLLELWIAAAAIMVTGPPMFGEEEVGSRPPTCD